MQLTLEQWPGGRWFRDRGNGIGHLWGHVQVIKAPVLLELSGPMFMSYPALNHVEVKLEQRPGGTHVDLRHRAIGLIDPAHRKGVNGGWKQILEEVNQDCTARLRSAGLNARRRSRRSVESLVRHTRRSILDLLRHGPRTTTEIVEAFPHLSRFGVMKHMEVLREAGLIHTREERRQRINSLNVVPIRQIYERWVGRFEELWSSHLLRIKEDAEAMEMKKRPD
jgi:DNA-binding transcriptional ArsR family regulator